ncbi:MAG: RsmB/NOP family class I SAM-dependent RNA methyltransferase [Desulfovermiculus sp.]
MRDQPLSPARSRLRTFRLVCRPYERPAVEALLREEGFGFEPEPFLDSARILTTEPKPLGSSVAAAFGLIYILDKSSMLPPLCLAPGAGEAVVDLCASPGSKTGVLAELVGEHGLVVANEPKPKRYQTLGHNLEHMNLPQVIRTRYPGESFPDCGGWGNILLDVPCSGWGTAQKNPQVLSLWREETLGPLLNLQQRLLTRAAEILAPGGRIMYSTCTTNREENETQVMWAVSELGLDLVPLDPWPGFVFEPPQDPSASGVLRVNGPASGGQSFFVGSLCKPGNWEPEVRPGQGVQVAAGVQERMKTQVNWQTLPPGRVGLIQDRLEFCPEPARHWPGLIWQGVFLGRGRKGLRLSPRARRLLPDTPRKQDLKVDQVQVLSQLLQGQSLPAPGPGPLAGLYWQDLPLGWVTIKGRRCMWTDRI